ncbi:hypothetical protein ACFQS6_05175 [Xanthomonas populi]
MSLPDTTRRPAQWSDAIHFPRYLLETGKEGMALVKHAWNTAGAVKDSVSDVLFRHVSSNMLATFAANSVGRFIASPWRGGSDRPLPNEALNAPAVLVGQGATTATNDMVWNSVKSKNGSYTAHATRLDQARAVEAARHESTIAETTQALCTSIDSLKRVLGPEHVMEEGRITTLSEPLQRLDLQQLFGALDQLNLETGMQDVQLERVDAACNASRQAKAVLDSSVQLQNRQQSIDAAATLIDQLDTLQQAMRQRQQLKQWEQGRG